MNSLETNEQQKDYSRLLNDDQESWLFQLFHKNVFTLNFISASSHSKQETNLLASDNDVISIITAIILFLLISSTSLQESKMITTKRWNYYTVKTTCGSLSL